MSAALAFTPSRTWLEAALRPGPVWWAFGLSLVLSIIATKGAITPNNDGMLYIEVARAYQHGGLDAARGMFDWIFLPLCMAALSSVTGLSLESSGYLLSALLLAGTCALLVACVREHFPAAGWAACVAVLAVPGLNNYRDYIIREFGAWFLLVLALWLLLRWARDPSWRVLVAAQVAICAAALFRLESLVFLAAPVLWQFGAVRTPGGWRRVGMLLALPVAALAGLLALWALGIGNLEGRLAYQLGSIDPARKLEMFGLAADRVADAVLNKYSADEASSILFFGILSILPIKFLTNLGVFALPFVLVFRRSAREYWVSSPGLFAWAFIIYALVLVAFVFEHFFLTSRYVAFLNLLAMPLVALGAHRMFAALPRLRWVLLAVAVVAMLANVISTSPPKTRYVDAARWLTQQGYTQDQVYFEEQSVAYLAGMNAVLAAAQGIPERTDLAAAVAEGRFQVLFLRGARGNTDVEEWAAAHSLEVVERFTDGSRRTVVVLIPGDTAGAAR